MQPTPAHDAYNPDLFALIPPGCARVVEVGCSVGALAKAYLAVHPRCDYRGVEVDPDYAEAARRQGANVYCWDIETMSDADFAEVGAADCVVFGDVLEHLRDPWALLSRLRAALKPRSRVIACLPNMQHWSVQIRLATGQLRYEPSGLLDRTHLRWFTRATALELFQSSGYRVVEGRPRIFEEPQREAFLPAIGALARAAGFDPQQAVTDALAMQYVFVAIAER